MRPRLNPGRRASDHDAVKLTRDYYALLRHDTVTEARLATALAALREIAAGRHDAASYAADTLDTLTWDVPTC